MRSLAGSGAALSLLLLAACQQPAAPEEQAGAAQLPAREPGAHTVLTAPLTEAAAMQAIVEDAVFAPDAELPSHYHPGEEMLYMIEGSVELFQQDKPAITLVAGDAYAIPAGLVHRAKAGPDGGRAVIFRAHPKGEPVRIAADPPSQEPAEEEE